MPCYTCTHTMSIQKDRHFATAGRAACSEAVRHTCCLCCQCACCCVAASPDRSMFDYTSSFHQAAPHMARYLNILGLSLQDTKESMSFVPKNMRWPCSFFASKSFDFQGLVHASPAARQATLSALLGQHVRPQETRAGVEAWGTGEGVCAIRCGARMLQKAVQRLGARCDRYQARVYILRVGLDV